MGWRREEGDRKAFHKWGGGGEGRIREGGVRGTFDDDKK